MYGMGWAIFPAISGSNFTRDQPFSVVHTGGAVGASSVLYILPTEGKSNDEQGSHPNGVVVAILCNMEGVGLAKTAQQIAREFEVLKPLGPYKVQKVYQCWWNFFLLDFLTNQLV